MYAVLILIVAIVMVSFALEVHHRMLLLTSIRHHDGNASMGQRLQAHAKHQGECRQTAAHNQILLVEGRTTKFRTRGGPIPVITIRRWPRRWLASPATRPPATQLRRGSPQQPARHSANLTPL